ncbi:DUF3768 domain-containing protein [Methylobacterium sp. WL12]|uniref:DUF3768 domain-containing protein n=1 Tax=Methylobacterium sp. WL12 TaxID=2603890 RepID=UPI001FEEDC38|nr:DUF3768 domain-containing protein [Methylobacterium sp. WL12]
MTAGVANLTEFTRAAVLAAVRAFDPFDAANDPHGEHDFSVVAVAPVRKFWKIDAYYRMVTFASLKAGNPAVTIQVLTVMLAEEW